jgi:hypothetical protein
VRWVLGAIIFGGVPGNGDHRVSLGCAVRILVGHWGQRSFTTKNTQIEGQQQLLII